MVVFDVLQVTEDAKNLLIHAHINEANFYKGYTITELYINTDKNFLESGVNTKDYVYHEEFEEGTTSIGLAINCNQLKDVRDFGSNLFFIYVKVKPAANECSNCIPCILDKEWTLGVTFDTGLLYNIALGYIKELSDECSVPQGFTDFILHWEGFKILLESEHYIDAVKMFNKLFKKGIKVKSSNCSCHGRIPI